MNAMAQPSGATTRPSAIGAPAYTQSFPREGESAALARRLVTAALDTWHLPELADIATLVVTELVANAVNHARGSTIRVTVTRVTDRVVRIAVVDKDRNEPQMRAAGPDDERGRGLAIVDAMSARWGVDLLRWGKRVWADVEGER